MKRTPKRNGGFTLMELMVTILTASIVTVAATTVLLMALRVNRQASDTASKQNTTRALLTAMENAAADGNIQEIVSGYDSWELRDNEGAAIFSYVSADQTIYTNGVEILKEVYASNASLDEHGLLTVSIETADGTYSSSILCRMKPDTSGDTVEEEVTPTTPGDTTNDPGRKEFLEILKKEYRSRGEIKNGDDTYTYYSEWYIGGYEGKTGWNEKTPWCACYISWALVKSGMNGPAEYITESSPDGHKNWFANVDEFMVYLKSTGGWYASQEMQNIQPGDLIFFDWIINSEENPQHVGVVLSVDVANNIVYTIEGNSAGRVAIRSYQLNDKRILGYGILSWNG